MLCLYFRELDEDTEVSSIAVLVQTLIIALFLQYYSDILLDIFQSLLQCSIEELVDVLCAL